jgi:ADP-ribosyl-[dinitrogen reductase] hydrolase
MKDKANFDKVSDCLHSKEVLSVINELNFEVRDKIKGMIAGNILGDILGLPFEGTSGKIDPYPPLKLKESCSIQITSKLWSDDTSMLIALASSLFETGGIVDAENERKHYLKWFFEGEYTLDGKVFGYGKTTKEALITKNPKTDRFSNGNGALMRSSVLVPYYLNKTDKELEEASGKSCAVTHGHPVSIFTNIIYTFILKRLLLKFNLNDALQQAKDKYFNIISDINEIFEKPVFYVTTPYCITTLQAALYINLESQSFAECILKAVNLGGDTDTIAAVTGAISGAIYGFESFDKQLQGVATDVMSRFESLKIFL